MAWNISKNAPKAKVQLDGHTDIAAWQHESLLAPCGKARDEQKNFNLPFVLCTVVLLWILPNIVWRLKVWMKFHSTPLLAIHLFLKAVDHKDSVFPIVTARAIVSLENNHRKPRTKLESRRIEEEERASWDHVICFHSTSSFLIGWLFIAVFYVDVLSDPVPPFPQSRDRSLCRNDDVTSAPRCSEDGALLPGWLDTPAVRNVGGIKFSVIFLLRLGIFLIFSVQETCFVGHR